MEKDIDKIAKNQDTDIVIRIDDFGGKIGLTIREFVKGERYTGFTKAGTRIPADKFKQFKAAINSIDEEALIEAASLAQSQQTQMPQQSTQSTQKALPDKKPATKKKVVTDIQEEEF